MHAMTLTNRYELPEAFVRAIANDPYSKGDADFSVTQLLQPPQLARLAAAQPIVEDVTDRIWALLGQAVHVILERAAEPSALAEKRYDMAVIVDGREYVVGGGFDHLKFAMGKLTDYKVTSVYARDGKVEWEQQLNLLRLLLEANGHTITQLEDVLIFRDWRPREAQQQRDYPACQVGIVKVDLWPREKAMAFLRERIRDHVAAQVRPCTDEERWAQPEKWALMKKGLKKAIKLYDVKPREDLLPGQFWEHRPGAFRRCEGYCPVADRCPQWAKDRKDLAQPGDDLEQQLQASVDAARAA